MALVCGDREVSLKDSGGSSRPPMPPQYGVPDTAEAIPSAGHPDTVLGEAWKSLSSVGDSVLLRSMALVCADREV